MKGENMRNFMLCLALMAGWGFAQDAPAQNAPETPVRDIRDIRPGMSRDHVLAGLGDKYDLSRIGDPDIDYWEVRPKDDPKGLPDRESGTIVFSQGKVFGVNINPFRSMTGGGALFAERLFWLLYRRADPLSSPDSVQDKLYKLNNGREATLPFQLEDRHDEKSELLTIHFTLSGQNFSITILKLPGKPDNVEVEQNICCATTNQK
jgi:hypothetical protein